MKNPQPLREGKLYVRVINSQHDIQSSSSSSSWIWSVLICGAEGGGGHSMRRKLRCEMYSYGLRAGERVFRFDSNSKCFRTGRDFSGLPAHVSSVFRQMQGKKFVVLFRKGVYVIFGCSSSRALGEWSDAVKGVLYLRKSLKRMSQKRMSQKRMTQSSKSNEDLLSRPTIPSQNRKCLSRLSYNNLLTPSSSLDELELTRNRFHLFFPLRLQTIILSCMVTRINLNGVLRERVFVLSGRAVYVLKQKKPSLKPRTIEFVKNLSCSRRIPVRFLDRVMIQESTRRVLIKFRKQSDILIEFDAPMSHDISNMFSKCVAGLKITHIPSNEDITSLCVYRNDPRYKWKGETSR